MRSEVQLSLLSLRLNVLSAVDMDGPRRVAIINQLYFEARDKSWDSLALDSAWGFWSLEYRAFRPWGNLPAKSPTRACDAESAASVVKSSWDSMVFKINFRKSHEFRSPYCAQNPGTAGTMKMPSCYYKCRRTVEELPNFADWLSASSRSMD